jgi:predicted small lipoprotein YifL
MRPAIACASAILLAACGQTGALYLPDESVKTPVEIRTPGTTTPEPAKKEEEKKAAQPPGR